MSVHLCVRSHYSLLNGTMSVQDVVATAKNRGFDTVAITEKHVLFSALEFFIEARKQGIKPILGLEITIADAQRTYSSLVLAKNNRGYQHLISFSYKLSLPASSITPEDLCAAQDDIFVILYSESGPFEAEMITQDWTAIGEKIAALKRTMGPFTIGISHQESSFFADKNHMLDQLASQQDIETVALTKVYYKDKAHELEHRLLMAIDKGTHLEDKTLVSAPNRYFYSADELAAIYPQRQLDVARKIADQCQVDLLELKTTMPVYVTQKNAGNDRFLNELAKAGLNKRLHGKVSQQYAQRLDYELGVINDMAFTDYFLIVYDIIRFAKKQGIYVGPGRGSSAGSLTAYCLGITEVDPLEYDLIFERFLNPERISMPDIDIDFPDDKRHLIIDYVRGKYGDQHIAHIATFGTLKAKQSFRDVCRILQVPLRKVDQATKLINETRLAAVYQNNARFKVLIDADELLSRAYDYAQRIEGTLRHVSIHAAGIVFSKANLLDVCPVIWLDESTQSIQYGMNHIEAIGLTKIDLLGLRNLTIIDNIAQKIQAQDPDFNIMFIPLDDKKTYSLIAKGETIGIFQLESEGMKSLLKKIKPRQFMDIVDTIALYRPGPMENIPLYLKNREHPQAIVYLDDRIRSITQSTYGILVYQEQIMQVAQTTAGFSLAKADILRKAMSKKDGKELAALRNDFIQGCLANGYTDDFAHQVFALIDKFANYGFNKSHSVAYGLIAYQLAYLKANYTDLFYSYLLSSVIGSETKTKQYIEECRRNHVLLLSINLERSANVYQLEDNKIRLPFTIIKGISQAVGNTIIQERNQNGPYLSYYDAVSRLMIVGFNHKNLEVLIDAGAFDYFGLHRLSMVASLEEAIRYAELIKIDIGGSVSLNRSLVSEPTFTEAEASVRTELTREKHALGFYFSDHPAVSLKYKHKTDGILSLVVGSKQYRVIGMVETVRTHRAKNGKMMAFAQISDDTGVIDSVIFPNVYETIKRPLNHGDLILFKGHVKEAAIVLIDEIHIIEMNS